MALTAYRTGNGNFQNLTCLPEAQDLSDKSKQMWKLKSDGPPAGMSRTANKRAEKRLLCSDLVRLRWVDRNRVRREEFVVVEGFSTSGASILLNEAINEGTAVRLCGSGGVLRAVVRHCGPAENGYLAGVCFWDQPRNYVPEHLLDLSPLHDAEK